MISNHAPILPTNASPLEQRAAQCLQLALHNPIPIADLINPDRCPVALLPYLAWAFSVDKWDENWTEAVKRLAIKQAFFIHKHKGTISAIRRVVEPIGYLSEVKEWWQENPQGIPGTFSLAIDVSENGINEETHRELLRLVDDVKPVSRHLTLSIRITPQGKLFSAAACYESEMISVSMN